MHLFNVVVKLNITVECFEVCDRCNSLCCMCSFHSLFITVSQATFWSNGSMAGRSGYASVCWNAVATGLGVWHIQLHRYV